MVLSSCHPTLPASGQRTAFVGSEYKRQPALFRQWGVERNLSPPPPSLFNREEEYALTQADEDEDASNDWNEQSINPWQEEVVYHVITFHEWLKEEVLPFRRSVLPQCMQWYFRCKSSSETVFNGSQIAILPHTPK